MGITDDARYTSTAWWANRLLAVRNAVYPSGPPATLPDTVTAGFGGLTKPTGCASITRYTVTNCGGRAGGSVIRADLCIPSATAVNKCLVFMTGHNQTATGWSGPLYCDSDGSSIIIRMLANGWHVLCVDLPAYGTQVNPQDVVLNSVTQHVASSHPYASGIGDGGPSINRLFTDHVIMAMNQITATYGITAFALAGHSGGSQTASIIAPLDTRFKCVHIMQVGSYLGQGSSGDVEGWTAGNPSMSLVGSRWWEYVAMVCAVAGRKTCFSVAPLDEYNPNLYDNWIDYVQYLNIWTGNMFPGAAVSLYQKNGARPVSGYVLTPYHDIDSTQAAFVEAHLLANT